MSSDRSPPSEPIIASTPRHRVGRSLAIGLGLVALIVGGLYAAAWYPYLRPRLFRDEPQVPRPPFPAPRLEVDAASLELPAIDPRLDKVALRRMLREARYAELEERLDALWQATRSDPVAELALREAYDAFYLSDQATRAGVEAWIAARPRSVEADIAAALHYVDSAWAARGTRYRADTPAAQFEAMEAALDRARRYLERAAARAPDHLMVVLARLRLLHLGGWDEDYVAALEDGLARHPKSYAIRYIGQWTAEPRWGGSHQIMDRIARSGAPFIAEHPAMARLASAADVDRADALARAGDLAGALRVLRRAEGKGDSCGVRTERAQLWARVRDHGRVVEDAQACLAAFPQHTTALELKAEALHWLALLAPPAQRAAVWAASERHFARLAELEPTEDDAREWLGYLAMRRDQCLADPEGCSGCRDWSASHHICDAFEARAAGR